MNLDATERTENLFGLTDQQEQNVRDMQHAGRDQKYIQKFQWESLNG
jgi:hypothetical protein